MNAVAFPAALCIEVPISDSTRTIRVRAENGPRLAAALVAAGFQTEWLGAGTAYTCQDGGCSDPECCGQHICRFQPHLWGCVRTTASGSQAHRVWARAGLVRPLGRRVSMMAPT
jgi:hypothetical protein